MTQFDGLTIEMDRDMPQGMFIAVNSRGQITPITLGQELPADTVGITVSIEDYGAMLGAVARKNPHPKEKT